MSQESNDSDYSPSCEAYNDSLEFAIDTPMEKTEIYLNNMYNRYTKDLPISELTSGSSPEDYN